LAADSSFPGQRPAQLARCPAEGKRVMSGPISARMTERCAEVSWPLMGLSHGHGHTQKGAGPISPSRSAMAIASARFWACNFR
jgi:hypothetical protein